VIVPAPAFSPIAAAGPTNLAPGSKGTIAVYVQNVGGKTSEGQITLSDQLPAGIVTTATPEDPGKGGIWACTPTGAGQSTVECKTTEAVPPGLTPRALDIAVEVKATAVTGENTVTVKGGGAAEPPATFKAPVTISETPAKAGIAAITAATYNPDGTKTTAAASHPYASDVGVLVNTIRTPDGKAVVPAGDPRTIAVDLPPGFLGNPTATPRCPEGLRDSECPLASQVGLAAPLATDFGSSANASGVHSTEAPIGYPAKFTFGVVGDLYQANLLAKLRSDEDYGVTVEAPNLAQINPVYGSFASIWGSPGSPSHDKQRCAHFNAGGVGTECGPGAGETAFVTMAADCALEAEAPPFALVSFDSWQDPGAFSQEAVAIPAVSECEALSLEAEELPPGEKVAFKATPESSAAASPSGLTTELTLPQKGLIEPEALAAPPLKEALINFPEGVTLNAAAAEGLATCSLAQIGFREFGPEPNRTRFDKAPAHCPDAAKVGSLEVKTELLKDPLQGSLYLAAQDENPFSSLLAVYLVIEDPKVGITIKLPGEMRTDPASGRLSTIFKDLPPAAVGKVTVQIKGGPRAPLATPDTCGTFTTTTELTPWSAPESGPAATTEDSFEVSSDAAAAPACPKAKTERPFAPALSAGTATTTAGAFAPFELKITRKDGEAELKGLALTLPPGLSAKFAGISTCSDAQIAAAEAPSRSGRAELASPSCPANSAVGSLTTAAGLGGSPIHLGGKVYLAGPYKGAPLSFAVIVPAVAGPYDLGDVVSRSAVYLNPETAQPSAVTDPIPDILKGIPVQLRQIKLDLDRPGFVLNPTSCAPMSIAAHLVGKSKAYDATVPFQAGGCAGLAFKPKFKAKLHGGTSRNAHPRFANLLSYPTGGGYANTAFAQVALPHSEFLDQSHIVTVCTRVQFAADACPAGSIYGQVEATTPLLEETLTGNIYLRSSAHKLPDLVIALKGPPSRPIEVDLAGRVDSVHGGIRTTFEGVPDAPVSKVAVTLKGGAKGLIVNSRDLCQGKRARLTVRLIGQNGKRGDQFPVLGNDCGRGRGQRK
jgi:hypothetical protein